MDFWDKKVIPVIIEWNFAVVYKIIAVISGTLMFCSLIFGIIVLLVNGLNFNKLLYPVLAFIFNYALFMFFKDKYVNS
jgi:hypothetical protein